MLVSLGLLLACGPRLTDSGHFWPSDGSDTGDTDDGETDDGCEAVEGDAGFEREVCTSDMDTDELADCLCRLYPTCPCSDGYAECLEETLPFVNLLMFETDACAQAVITIHECSGMLSCEERATYEDYLDTCAEEDPDGSAQPFCQAETMALAEDCNGISLECGG
jgi:hypothetical protein